MSLTETMAAVGVIVQGTLALLMLVIWRRLGERWALLVAAGFFAVVAQYFNVALGHYSQGGRWTDPPGTLNTAMGLVAQGLVTSGLVDYVGLSAAAARRWRLATAAAVVGLMLTLAAGWMTRIGVIAFVAGFVCSWAALFGWAMRREPGRGHGIVMLAVLVWPLTMVSALLGWLSVTGAGISLIAPDAVLGMTLLMTGLIRAQDDSMHEIAARQRAQAELERNNQTLELRVASRTAQMRETIAGLESFNRSVSHDLRGPLGGITGVAHIAREALARGDLADADRLLGAIERQAQSSTDLVASLLQLARAGEEHVERRKVHTTALVEEVADLLGGATAARAVIHVDRLLPDLEADPALLRQVFANLLANGVKFSATAAEPRVEVGATRTPEGIVFFVNDNGVGFSDAQARDLFVPFRRLHADRFEGHGIGLTIVRRIVERHGGRLWAEGRPGRGATFYFTLEEQPAGVAG